MNTSWIVRLLVLLLLSGMLFSCGSASKSKRKKKKRKGKTEVVSPAKSGNTSQQTDTRKETPPPPKGDPRVEKVLAEAKAYIGTPYKYGGTTRAGMDCSGLVVTAFKAAGIELPRTSREQSQKGKPVEKQQLRPGDLVFFSRSYNKEVGHAGIVVESGPNQAKFIHASTSKGVRIDDLYGEYWSKLFLMARRVF